MYHVVFDMFPIGIGIILTIGISINISISIGVGVFGVLDTMVTLVLV